MEKIGILIPVCTPIVPFGTLPCDGRYLEKAKCPALFSVIGTLYGETGIGNAWFKIPSISNTVIQVNGKAPLNTPVPSVPLPENVFIPTTDYDWDQQLDFASATSGKLALTDLTLGYLSRAKSAMGDIFVPGIPSIVRLEFRIVAPFEGVFGFSELEEDVTEVNSNAAFKVAAGVISIIQSEDEIATGVDAGDDKLLTIEINRITDVTSYRIDGVEVHTEAVFAFPFLQMYGEGAGSVEDIKVYYTHGGLE